MKPVIKILTNKYLLTTAGFLAWTIFFDQNDWVTMEQHKKELKGIKDDIAYLNGEINRMNKEKVDLVSNPMVLEQYAREHYRMKHDGEDVYVIEQ